MARAKDFLNQQITNSYKRHAISINTPVSNVPTQAIEASLAEEKVLDRLILNDGIPLDQGIGTSKRKLRPSDPPSSLTNGFSTPKKSKPSKPPPVEKWPPPSARLSEMGGISKCIEQILELVAMPLVHPEIYLHTGVKPPRGVLLCGPPGCGKTMLAGAIAGELGYPFINISAPSVVSGMSGESEKTLRDTFAEAAKLAPCILFIDEIDAITPKRETAQREMERRIVAQLLTCLDGKLDLAWEKTEGKPVMLIGATNRPDSLDPALRRAGRFDNEINMGVPNEEGREQILSVLSAKMRLSGDFDLRLLAKQTPGYVGADLAALTSAAGIIAVKRIFGDQQPLATDNMNLDSTPIETAKNPTLFSNLPLELQSLPIASFLQSHPDPLTSEQLEPLAVTNADFSEALSQVQPSSKREGFTTIPDVTWSQVGALTSIRGELKMAIIEPIRQPELFSSFGIQTPCGVLLWGPPGCGKTLVAKAVANESRANFISVKGPELLNKYVGESERAVRQVFARARASAPCIIFFDELDALVPKRDDSLTESSARVVNTLLTELDGLEPRKEVYVIGATNRPDMIDPAMVRPGRLDKLLFVDLPLADERFEILKTQSLHLSLNPDVNLLNVAHDSRCDGFSGADLSALIREAAVAALSEALSTNEKIPPGRIAARHFHSALEKVSPSVSKVQRKRYALLHSRFSGIPFGQKEVSSAATTSEDA